MALHSKKLSFTRPIMLSFAGILCSFAVIAIAVTLSQRKDFLEDYHQINSNFTHNLAVNYTESILRENDYILGRSAMYFARDDRLNETLNVNPTQGLQMMMHLQNLMPTVSSISLADTQGHYLRAPEVLPTEKSKTFDPRKRPWFIAQAEASIFSHYTRPYMDYFTGHPTVTLYKPLISPEGRLKNDRVSSRLDVNGLYTASDGGARSGEFFVVERDGAVVLHPDTGALFKQYVSEALMDKMTSGEGHLYDKKKQRLVLLLLIYQSGLVCHLPGLWRDAHRYHPPRNNDCWLGVCAGGHYHHPLRLIPSPRLAYRADAHYQCHQNRRRQRGATLGSDAEPYYPVQQRA